MDTTRHSQKNHSFLEPTPFHLYDAKYAITFIPARKTTNKRNAKMSCVVCGSAIYHGVSASTARPSKYSTNKSAAIKSKVIRGIRQPMFILL